MNPIMLGVYRHYKGNKYEVIGFATHTEAIRAMWLMNYVQSAAEELNMPIMNTAKQLEEHGLVEWALDGYEVLHTQGYEYMGEVLADTLHERRGELA